MTITPLNLSVLRETFAGGGAAPCERPAVDLPHLRRCLKAGLLRVEGRTLYLTDAGRVALGR